MASKPSQFEIDPNEVFLDSSNLPSFETERFEGRLEKALSKRTVVALTFLFFAVVGIFSVRVGVLQISQGRELRERSETNHLRTTPIFSKRGVIYDSKGELLVWNDTDGARKYSTSSGHAHVLGYVGFPDKDEPGYVEEKNGKSGAEKLFDQSLRGISGLKIEEVDSRGVVSSESIREVPEDGKTLTLTIDTRIQKALYQSIDAFARDRDFVGGSAVVLDIHTGSVIALVSYPEFDATIMSLGKDADIIGGYFTDERKVFLNRAAKGVYTPGSIFKPFVAIAALAENIVAPEKEFESTGTLLLPNPYNPDNPTPFKDWKAHGYISMTEALSVSSNIYFYIVGGGFKSQPGLGITRIEKYARKFGFGTSTGLYPDEEGGVVPNPTWKSETFDGEDWTVGDTYHTAIGQYGFLVTPLQMARAIGAIANEGTLVTPRLSEETPIERVPVEGISIDEYEVIHSGMELAVSEGTARGLQIPGVSVAAKTGTAELDQGKRFVNSWVTGYFPAENPKYSFAIVMEKGPRSNTVGATMAMRNVLEWMSVNTPEYFGRGTAN